MVYCCPQCTFTAQFESALIMHMQLEHNSDDRPSPTAKTSGQSSLEQSTNSPRLSGMPSHSREGKATSKGLSHSNSATRLFDKLRTRICRSKMALFVHPEESSVLDLTYKTHSNVEKESAARSVKHEGGSSMSQYNEVPTVKQLAKESYRCHLCSFVADRITVLDRHLLNDHKIGLDNLMKLVMAKTKEGINENNDSNSTLAEQPYYKAQDEIIEEGDFVIETVAPKIKILKHAASNTDLNFRDIPDVKDSCKTLRDELESMINFPIDASSSKEELFAKMQRLNEYMCKFVESNNTLKRALKKDFDSKSRILESKKNSYDGDLHNFGTGDLEVRHNWSGPRPHSDRTEIGRSRKEKTKSPSSSFYY